MLPIPGLFCYLENLDFSSGAGYNFRKEQKTGETRRKERKIMEFHEKLQALRKQKGLTQEALAQALYVSRTAISKWESGRGYPNIDSLKAIAGFFSVTVDQLLSGEELLTAAEEDVRQREMQFGDVVFGGIDCSAAMFLFLPFFRQTADGVIQSVSLLQLSGVAPWLRADFFAVVIAITACGVVTLALQNCRRTFWVRHKRKLSILLDAAGALLFAMSLQPYAAAFLLIFLTAKVLLLLKWK